MLSQRLANIVFVTSIFLACIYFALEAETFETSGLLASSGLPSKFFPQLMLTSIAICSVIVGFQYFFKGEAGGDKGKFVFEDFPSARRGILMLVVSIVCYFIWQNYGFIAMAIVMAPLSLLAMGVRNPVIYFVVLALTASIYFIFTSALGIQLV